MIISASYRTDIPAFYGAWFVNRLRAGFVRVVNPYGGAPYRVALDPASAEGFVFWTRNLEPFAESLELVSARGQVFVVQFTVTGYPQLFDRSVVAPERAVDQLLAVRRRWGPRAAVWRYDPLLWSSLTPPAWHLENFTSLAAQLRGVVDEVVVSVMQPYRKTLRNLAAAAGERGFTWDDPPLEEKRALIADLAGRAADHGMALTLCTQPALSGIAGTRPAACIDAGRLSDVAGRAIVARVKGNRAGCACAESRDIGAYDSCPHGCIYCYAVTSRGNAQVRFRSHDPNGDFLFNPR